MNERRIDLSRVKFFSDTDSSVSPAGAFVAHAIRIGALEFIPEGRQLKSGRISPYFFNSGLFTTARDMSVLGEAYADAIMYEGSAPDVFLGPPYKGIPIAVAAAQELSYKYGSNSKWASYRKEAKTHGDTGLVLGASCENQHVAIVDDVITTGASKREAVEFIRNSGGIMSCAVVGFDRLEKGWDPVREVDLSTSAAQDFVSMFDKPLIAVATLDDLIALLGRRECEGSDADLANVEEMYHKVLTYRDKYGI